uniref:Uncharacterized protein LOC104226906 n=1 Tax=Nicotiana sylvestris TaxID=4096 RepID=A0A1U7WRJ3_NICSY
DLTIFRARVFCFVFLIIKGRSLSGCERGWTNGNSDPTQTPASSTDMRTVFHEDDYTHPCHPLYVHPSDVLGTSLVSTPFDGTCYGSWRRTVLVALSIRNKTGFITGATERPPDGSPLARQWKRCNDLVISWLVNSLSKDITRSVEYSEFAKDIWNEYMVRLIVPLF